MRVTPAGKAHVGIDSFAQRLIGRIDDVLLPAAVRDVSDGDGGDADRFGHLLGRDAPARHRVQDVERLLVVVGEEVAEADLVPVAVPVAGLTHVIAAGRREDGEVTELHFLLPHLRLQRLEGSLRGAQRGLGLLELLLADRAGGKERPWRLVTFAPVIKS